MSKNKICPECKKGVLHKHDYSKDGRTLFLHRCTKCGYEEKVSNIRDARWERSEPKEE